MKEIRSAKFQNGKVMIYLSFSSNNDPAELIEELLPRNNIPYYVVHTRFGVGVICVFA